MSYGLYVGKNLTADGIAYLAGYGDEPSSHWLEIIPRQEHDARATIRVGVTADADLPGVITEIPQAKITARHIRVSYSYYKGVPAPLTNGGLNEHGVAVRDIWSPSRPELVAMTPLTQTGLNYSDLAHIVLERARTAREGVLLIGELVAKHGEATYGGNSHIIADSEEAWVVIQFSGGQGLWAAERLGPDSIRASRPGYIGEIPVNKARQADFLYSPNFVSFAVSQGWYDPAASTPFNANAIYGDGKGKWAGVQWIEAEMAKRSNRPEKVRIEDVMWAVRTERLTGDTAGYGQVVPLAEPAYPELRLIWHTQIGAVAAPFVPVFMGVQKVPEEFRMHRYLTAGESSRFLDMRHAISSEKESVSRVSQGVESTRSATQIFKRLLNLVFQQSDSYLSEVTAVWEAVEQRLLREQRSISKSAQILLSVKEHELAIQLLTYYTKTELLSGLDLAEKLAQSIEIRIRSLSAINATLQPRAPMQLW